MLRSLPLTCALRRRRLVSVIILSTTFVVLCPGAATAQVPAGMAGACETLREEPREVNGSERAAAILYLLDKSRSVQSEELLKQSSNGIRSAIYEIPEGIDVGVVAFDSAPLYLQPLKPNTRANRERLARRLHYAVPAGKTKPVPAFAFASEQLAPYKGKGPRHAVLVTDGKFENPDDVVQRASALCREGGICTNVVALGSEGDGVALRSVARAGRGRFVRVCAVDSIPREISDLSVRIGRNAGCGCSLPAVQAFSPKTQDAAPASRRAAGKPAR